MWIDMFWVGTFIFCDISDVQWVVSRPYGRLYWEIQFGSDLGLVPYCLNQTVWSRAMTVPVFTGLLNMLELVQRYALLGKIHGLQYN